MMPPLRRRAPASCEKLRPRLQAPSAGGLFCSPLPGVCMANDAGQIRFAPNGALYVAPAPNGGSGGTVLPTSVNGGAAPAGFSSFGYVNESGVTITPTVNTDPVNVWQSAVPVLYNVNSASFSVKATFSEVSRITTELFYGAEWVEVTDSQNRPTGDYRLDLSSVPELTEISLVVDWSDKGRLYRCVIPRAMISDRGAITLQRTASQEFELTFEALDYRGSLGYVLTNDSAIAGGGGIGEDPTFASSVTVPDYLTNDGSTAAWTARVVTTNQTGPAEISLLNAAGTAYSTVTTLATSGQYDVTIPSGKVTAELRVTHGGVSSCYSLDDNAPNGTTVTCTVA
ncbi:phage tail tube protein [Streptomyces sp. NPDC003444]